MMILTSATKRTVRSVLEHGAFEQRTPGLTDMADGSPLSLI